MNADVEQSTPYSATFGYAQSERVDGDMRQELIDAGIDMDAIFEATEQYSYQETGMTLGGLMGIYARRNPRTYCQRDFR